MGRTGEVRSGSKQQLAMGKPIRKLSTHKSPGGTMPRRGDGLVLRGKTWGLDFSHQGQRHQVRLGRNISRTVARELAVVERAKALKQEAGIGGKKRKDVLFDKAAEEFLKWAEANHRPKS